MYKNKKTGTTLSTEAMQAAADRNGMDITEYAEMAGYILQSEDEPQDFPTSTVEDADAVQQPMTASQAGFTESPSVDTPSESQDPEKLVDSFDEDLLSAKTKLQEISLSEEEINAIKVKANAAPSVKGVGMGATTIKIYPYTDFIEEAKKEIATETKVDIYNIPEKDWRERAKNLYIKNEEKILFDSKKEEVLEGYEKTIYGENPFSLARLKKFVSKATVAMPGLGLIPTKEELEYSVGRAILTESFKEDKEKATLDYEKAISSINDYETLLNTGAVELNALRKKQADFPGQITQEDVERANTLIQNQKIAYGLYADEFNKLENLETKAKTAAELADLTKRTYNNLDVATNRIASAGTRMIAGLGSVAKELSISEIVKRTTGADIRDEEGNLPVYLRNSKLDFYDKIFGSKEAEKTISNLYSLTKKIDEGTKERQELGKIKNIEDFGEFMLDLFSEQSVNTAVTIGLGGGGLFAVSAGAGGNKFNEMDLEVANDPKIKISPAQFYASGILFGAAEYLTEKVSLSQAKGALNYLGFGKKTFGKAFDISGKYSAEVISKSKALQNTFKSWGVNMAKEGGAEFSAQLLNNLTDINILNKEDIHWSDGLAESFISGSLMSGLGFNAPALVGGVANTFRTTSETDLYNKRGKEILRIRKEINAIQNNTGISNEASSQEAIKALQLELDGLVEQNILGIGVAAERVDELTSNDKRQLLDLDILINKSKRGIDKINNNTKLTNDAKDRLIEPLANNINLALKEKNIVLASSQNSAAKEKSKKIQIEVAEKAGLDFNIVSAKNKKEAVEKVNKLINDSNIEGENLSALKDFVSELDKTEDNVNGQYFGAQYGLPIALSLDENLIKNNMGATLLHEVGHATVFKKLLEGNADILGLVADLESYAIKNYKGAKEKLKNVEKNYPKVDFTDADIAEEKMAAILEYVSKVDISKDLTLQGKLINKWNKIKPKGKNKEINSIQTGSDVFALINSFSKSFDKGELSGLAEKVIKGEVKAKQIKEGEKKSKKSGKEAFSKSLELQEQLDNLDEFDFDNEVDFQTTKTNLETKIRLAKKKEASKPTEEVKPKDKTKIDTKKNEKQLGDQFDEMVPEGTTKEEYKKNISGKVVDKITGGMLDPLIRRIAARYGIVNQEDVYGKTMDEFVKDVISEQFVRNIMNYDPLAANKSLGGYIIAGPYGVLNRVKEALAKGKKEQAAGFGVGLDKAKNVKNSEESTTQEVERRKYIPLTKSNIIPNFTVTAIKDKLTKILSGLTTKMSDVAGKNAATTPIIAEIKREVGKVVGDPGAIPKLVIQRLGKLKDGTYEKNLIKHKKAIIENMTTTFLMGKDIKKKDSTEEVSGGIPQAIEKSVGGAYKLDEDGNREKVSVNVGGKQIIQDVFVPKFVPYPQWVGKEIDREKTLVRGATAGNQIVRRVPADKVSDADFVGLFIDEKGKLIPGRREALGKAIGEEIVFEIFTKEIQNENSEISKAFEGNQKAQEVVLSDNFVNEIIRDIDRGTVKFSLSTGDSRLDNARKDLGDYLTSKFPFPNGLSNEQFYGLVETDDSLKELFETLKKEYERYLGRIKTPRMTELAVKFNASGNENFNVFLNNYFNYKFSNISSALGVDRNSISRFKIKPKTAKKTKKFLQGYILDLVKNNPKTAAKTFITTLQSALASGTGQSLFGTNEKLNDFINSIKDEEVKKAFEDVSLTKSASGMTFQIGKEKITTNFKQETSAKDFISLIKKYVNNVKVKERNEYANKAGEAYLNFIDYLKDNNVDREITGFLLSSLGGSMRSSAKTLAKIKGAFLVEGLTAKDYTFEHGIPTNQLLVASALYIYDKNNNINRSFIENIIDKSSIYIIPTKISDAIDSFYRNTFSNDKALSETNPEFYRYFSKNKYFQAYLKDKGIYNFEQKNITDLLDPNVKVKKNRKFSKSSILKVTEKEFSNLSKQEDVYYHGTSAIVNEEFINKETVKDFPEGASSFSVEMQGLGKHYTKSLENAKSFIDHRNRDDNTGTVGAVSIVIRNPKQFKSYQALLKDIKNTVKNKNLSIAERNKTYLDTLKSNGFDSIIYKEGPSYNPSKKNLMAKAIIPFDSSKKLIGTADYNQRNEGMVKGSAVVNNIKKALDPKGEVYKPSVKFSKTMNSTFNKMLERKTGIAADETISKTIANRRGQKKGKYKIFMPSSLDDFKGLTSYTFAGKGKQGEADQKFFQDTLIDPYFKGIRAIEETRQAFKDDFRALNKQMKPVIKKLGKLVPGTEFTHDQAIRVALWNASGYEIPGISEVEQKKLVDYVNDNADLSEYARKLQQIAKRPKWAKPGDFWDAETILSDLNNLTEKVGRKEFLSEFIENAGIIFSEENLNKVQAGYGKATRDALEDILYRMENGTNRPSSTTDNTNRWNTWINNSIGAIMFFNRRSALLQTLSTVNFINWSDNNPLKAAAAFANQKQYWSDFATLFNSSKLKQRRAGLKSDVNEAEIARAVKGSRNKATAALSYLLKIGFTPTQMADSFAIAAGGATFYRNRIKSYLKKVNEDGEALYTKEQAEEMAFKDFSQISEETQQSGDPALISSDQASTAGRLLLAFQNTPIQLNRSIKKAALDIKNRRRTPGQTLAQSNFSNFSKIIYYGTIQNVIFSALQNALFALIPGFEEEDDELTEEEQLEKYGKVYSTKQSRIINGMIDTTLKGGFGLPGAGISMIKNLAMEYNKQEEKEFMADHAYTILAFFNIIPSIGSKGRKIYSAIQTKRFEKDVIEKRGWDVTIDGKFNLSPSYKVLGAVVEGFTNLPLDRAVTEINALTEALDYRNTVWQRAALALGWRSWDVGAENEEHELIKTEAKAKRKEEGKEKAKATRAENKAKKKAFYKRVSDALTEEEEKMFYRYKTITLQKKYLEKMAKEKNIK